MSENTKWIIAILSLSVVLLLIVCAAAFLLINVSPTPVGPIATPAPASTPELLEFEGNGDAVEPFVAPGRAARIGGSYYGDRFFSVEVLDGEGNQVERITICTDACDFDQFINLPGPGAYYLQVTTVEGNWFVVMALLG